MDASHLDFRSYFTADLAGKYRSTAGSQEPVSPALLETSLEALERDGYVVFEDIVPQAKLEEIRADITPRFKHESGRNNFEGFATRRLYSSMNETFVLNELVEHPLALGLLDRIFEPNYLLSQLQVIDIAPGEAAQPLHHDDGFYPWPRPRRALGAATIFAVDDFTHDNGATVVIPGSHTWDDHAPTEEETARAIPCVMPAGSMLLFLGTLWHGGGANRTDASRMCVTAQYCAPFCRTQENFSLSVDRDRVRQCSENIQRLLGYSIHAPFMGFVAGAHPKRLLEQPERLEPAALPD
jgi:ectoine hydroxylase-related dioxygenase (phytanoyl-CoA dioxygenase family)